VDCKNHIISDHNNYCLKCGVVIIDHCSICRLPYQKSWMIGHRDHDEQSLVDKYKFFSMRALAKPLAETLSQAMPVLPENTIIVPVPTVSNHIRERGFDHTVLLARHLAKLKRCEYKRILIRKSKSVQLGSSKQKRLSQAKEAFSCTQSLPKNKNYLILDDVYTTGATINAATRLLKQNGAQKIWVAVLARQRDQKIPTKKQPSKN
jgi:Predicted amidophosphoribosyltransferases